MNGCKHFSKINTVPIKEWMAATNFEKKKKLSTLKNWMAPTVPGKYILCKVDPDLDQDLPKKPTPNLQKKRFYTKIHCSC